ncbi:MAG TPA: YfhO family protein [Candidatus Binatia bacterium]|jgi:hypothetical protein
MIKSKVRHLSGDSLGLIVLTAMILWFAREMVWDGKVPFFRDLSPYFYPMKFTLAQSLKAWELPLWDRHMGMGYPLMADFQSSPFYPPHLFYLFFPFFGAVAAIFLFHYLLAAVGAYLLCRRWRYPIYLALIGGLLFSLGGISVSLSNLLNHFQAAVWLPWVLLFGEKVFELPSWKNFVAFSFVLLCQFLAGSPELYGMSMILVVLDGLRLKCGGATTYKRLAMILPAAQLLVIAAAMAQVLPTAELLSQSRGSRFIGYPEAVMWSLQPTSLMNLFVLDKGVETSLPGGIELFLARETPFFVTYYMGAAALVGIILWASYASIKELAVLTGLAAVSLVVALGNHTPVYWLLFQYVPLFRLFRFPEKFFFFTNALLLLAVVRGFYGFFRQDYKLPRGALVALCALCAGFAGAYFLFQFEPGYLRRLIGWATGWYAAISELSSVSGILVALERQTALTIAMAGLVMLRAKALLRTSAFAALFVGLVFADLTSAHAPYQYLLDPAAITQQPKILSPSEIGLNRIFYHPPGRNLHPNYFMILRRPRFEEIPELVFANLMPDAGVFDGVDYMQEIDAMGRWPYITFLDVGPALSPEARYRLLGALNVKYIVALRPLPPGGITLIGEFPKYPSWLYRVERVVPRTYIVGDWAVEKDSEKTLETLAQADFDPLSKALLAEPPTVPKPEKRSGGAATITQYTNQRVTIRASLEGSGLLVLADSYFPGWRVYVDGREEKIERVNLFFRGVMLSAGEHVVEFDYVPRSFAVGLAISLATIGGVVFVSLIARRRRARGDALPVC